MKKLCLAVLFLTGLSVYAQDLLVMRDGNIIQAKIMEIHPSEIRYKRFDNLNGPTIVIPTDRVFSIKYENGMVDTLNAVPVAPVTTAAGGVQSEAQHGLPASLQTILNVLPAISIAGNNLKFQFDDNTWTAMMNGENFSKGTVEFESTDDGGILTLKQTHIWPGAIGKTAGRVANMIPGGSKIGEVLNAAGDIAGAIGPIETPGSGIILEYKSGPPAKLSFVRTTKAEGTPADSQTTEDHPLTAANRFDLDGFGVFAISGTFSPPIFDAMAFGGGFLITVYESHKRGTFFTPSYFLSGKFFYSYDYYYGSTEIFTIGAGVLFKHRFPGDRILWNFGSSLELMWVSVWEDEPYTYTYSYEEPYYGSGPNPNPTTRTETESRTASYWGNSFLLGIGFQTGFSFRFNPYTSLDLNGFIKFGFGSVDATTDNYDYRYNDPNYKNYTIISDGGLSSSISHWPFTGGIEVGLTFMFPYRIRRQSSLQIKKQDD